MMPAEPTATPRFRFLGSALSAKLAAIPVMAALLFAGVAMTDHGPSAAEREAAVCRQVEAWKHEHAGMEGLRVVRIDVHFRARADHFVVGQGVVATPVAIDLPGYQRVVATAGVPVPVATLDGEGVHTVLWPYAGLVHRDEWFTALALVAPDAGASGEQPSRSDLIASALTTYDATRKAAESSDHGLLACKPFSEWAHGLAAGETPEQRLLAVASTLSARVTDFSAREPALPSRDDGACSAMAADDLSAHMAQVLTVMAARELDVPTFAFSGADPRYRYLVGMRAEAGDWRLLDLADVGRGFLDDRPPLIVEAPLIGDVTFAQHRFWDPHAAAFEPNGAIPISYTTWASTGEQATVPSDSTEASWTPLSELCSESTPTRATR